MPSSYPGALDAFTNPSAAGGDTLDDPPHDDQHADANDAIEAIETELGVNPRGSSATVRARLDAIESATSLFRPKLYTVEDSTNPASYTTRSLDKRLVVPDPGVEVNVLAIATVEWRFSSGNGEAEFDIEIGGVANAENFNFTAQATFEYYTTTIQHFRAAYTPGANFNVDLYLAPSAGSLSRTMMNMSVQLFPTGN